MPKKMKSNLPYYQKMKAKLETEISELQSQFEAKKKELALVQTTIESLQELEGGAK